MKDKFVTFTCGAAAFIALNGVAYAQAASPTNGSETLKAQSFAELLQPIPNATAALRAQDAALSLRPARLQLAQYHHHHHHHHHHSFLPGVAAGIVGGIVGGALSGPGYAYPHHCYWTLGRPRWDGYRWIRPRVRVCN